MWVAWNFSLISWVEQLVVYLGVNLLVAGVAVAWVVYLAWLASSSEFSYQEWAETQVRAFHVFPFWVHQGQNHQVMLLGEDQTCLDDPAPS